MTMLYLDHNATTPPAPEVLAAMLPVLHNDWVNPSSTHGPGQHAKRLLTSARTSVARALDCKPAELIFTSGATEANHLALCGLLDAAPAGRKRLLLSAVEHAGQIKLARWLATRGVEVDFIPVHAHGGLDLDAAMALLGPDVAAVSVMAANNETGVLMPVAALAALARAAEVPLHVDATQLIGKLPFSFAASGAATVALSAHKLRGPKGTGALLLRQGQAWQPQIQGSQERGRRGGTENLAGIVGLAAALERLGELPLEAARVAAMRDRLEAGLRARLPGVHIWGSTLTRLPGTSLLRFGQLSADVVLQRLERLEVAASSGAACSSGGSEPSHVLRAMGVPPDEALCAVRLSLGETTTAQEIDWLLERLPPLLLPLLSDAETRS